MARALACQRLEHAVHTTCRCGRAVTVCEHQADVKWSNFGLHMPHLEHLGATNGAGAAHGWTTCLRGGGVWVLHHTVRLAFDAVGFDLRSGFWCRRRGWRCRSKGQRNTLRQLIRLPLLCPQMIKVVPHQQCASGNTQEKEQTSHEIITFSFLCQPVSLMHDQPQL